MICIEENLLAACLVCKSFAFAPAPDSETFSVLDQQIYEEGVFKYLYVLLFQNFGYGEFCDPSACRISTGMQNSSL